MKADYEIDIHLEDGSIEVLHRPQSSETQILVAFAMQLRIALESWSRHDQGKPSKLQLKRGKEQVLTVEIHNPIGPT